MANKNLHIAMYPWFAIGHITSYLHISNKLAERGHKISFFLPTKTKSKFEPFNLHPNLISFIPVTLPQVLGLSVDAETTNDIPFPLHSLLMTAMDMTEPQIEDSLCDLNPHFVFFDFTHWLPKLATRLRIKSLHYCTVSPATIGYLISPERKLHEKKVQEVDLMEPPLNFPPSKITLSAYDAKQLAIATVKDYGKGVSFIERLLVSLKDCDAIGFKTCKEIEGPYCNYLESQFNKPVVLAGPVLPELPSVALEEKWTNLLRTFEAKTLIFCAFGSECVLSKDQFQELILGFEQTGLPFFVSLKPPTGFEKIEEALPEGFEERVKGRGYVYGGWVQQQLILKHPSIGCFVTHCGSGSLSEAMINECQLVLLPNAGDQIINARLMGRYLRVGVEVERGEEDGLFTRKSVCKAVKAVMDCDSGIGKEVRANHAKWREFLLGNGLENSYIDGFIQNLIELLG